MDDWAYRSLMAYYERKSADAIAEAANAQPRMITAVISSEAVDSDGEIVSALAIRAAMPEYMRNPVVLAGHKHRLDDGKSPVIGKVVKWWQDKDRTYVQVEFADTPLGNEYYRLYKDGFQKGFSIGFASKKRSTKLVRGKSATVHNEIQVYELSAIPLPSNPEALAVTKAMKDYITKEFAAMESRIVKSLTDKIDSLFAGIKGDIEQQLDGVKSLLIEKTNPNGCGGDSVGDPLNPSGEANSKTDMALLVKTVKTLIEE
ncbi:MAG: HK97 family phage prohead protease [Planctomycetaceae bacterium]|nr:HK97 family phage prohead protease [Planctomycetaceae bacterium]